MDYGHSSVNVKTSTWLFFEMKKYKCPLCGSKLEFHDKFGIKYKCPKCSFQILRESKSSEVNVNDGRSENSEGRD